MKTGNCAYRCPEDLPAIIPVFPLAGALLLPRSELPLNIFDKSHTRRDAEVSFDENFLQLLEGSLDLSGASDCAQGVIVLSTVRATD